MNSALLILIILGYLGLIFWVAYLAEKHRSSKWVNNPYIYTLSLAVYCSAWTYYGSVGKAATSGVEFLAIYLGPVIATPLWIVLLRKVIRIAKQHNVSSLADFISLRYGKNRALGAAVAVICVLATIPYIALQLKAISDTVHIVTLDEISVSTNVFDDSTFYIALLLALFATFFGTQSSDATEKHKGIIASIAFESLLKLGFFLAIGIYVTYGMFDGPSDIYEKFTQTAGYENLVSFGGIEDTFNWTFLIIMSFIAVFLLPRQFQVGVIENTRIKHLKTAIWLFPLYLLIFNLFVIYIAWGGNIYFGDTTHSEYYSLILPLQENNIILTLLVFLGGFSAVISMVVISTLALSTMVSNNIIIPYGFLGKFSAGHTDKNTRAIKNIRRISIFLIIALAYVFYILFSQQIPLISIGLMAFVIIAQLAPSFFIGMYWNRGSARGSMIGIIIGMIVTLYTLIIPFSIQTFSGDTSFIDNGLFGIEALKPYQLFGINFLNPTTHAFFWSFTLNTISYLYFSLNVKGNYRERNFAEIFIDQKNFSNLEDSALVWKGEAYVEDIRNLLLKFLGEKRTNRALNLFFKKYNLPADTQMADARLINFSEKLLAVKIGSASAQILISNVVKEEEISLVEVLQILEESKQNIETNRVLREKSDELTNLTDRLKDANSELRKKDRQKDEFLDTVAHEIKTPITGIKASAEILLDDIEDMPSEIRQQFLSNILNDSERLSRLIHTILDFEKLSTGRSTLHLAEHDLGELINEVCQSAETLLRQKNGVLNLESKESIECFFDRDRMAQVLTNLLSNAIKFADPDNGIVNVNYGLVNDEVTIEISDNGTGVPTTDLPYIFDKFFQSNDQNRIKPSGSGIGLAIVKQIVEIHKGRIRYSTNEMGGATFTITMPCVMELEKDE